MKIIVLTVANRPCYLREVLKGLGNQTQSLKDNCRLVINIEPFDSPENKECIDICQKIDFIDTDIKINKVSLGIKVNTFDVVSRGFEKYQAGSILYLEDDVVISPDTFELWDWYLKQDLSQVALLCLFSRYGDLSAHTVFKSRQMAGWGFVMTSNQWETYAKPVWLNPERMWDNNVAKYIRTFPGIYNLIPDLSRTTNVGVYGMNVNPTIYNKFMANHKWQQEKSKFNYTLSNEIKPHI